jgi:hypothetical protein
MVTVSITSLLEAAGAGSAAIAGATGHRKEKQVIVIKRIVGDIVLSLGA